MGEWSNGLCGCFNNITLCLITYVAPCYTAGKNAEAVGDSCMMVGALYALVNPAGVYFAAKAREKIREQKGIEVSCGLSQHVFGIISNFCDTPPPPKKKKKAKMNTKKDKKNKNQGKKINQNLTFKKKNLKLNKQPRNLLNIGAKQKLIIINKLCKKKN